MRYGTMLAEIKSALARLYGQEIDICLGSDMAAAIERWGAMYANRPHWLSKDCDIKTAGIPGAIAAEVARLVTLELKSVADNVQVDAVYQRALRELRTQVEQGLALGGLAIKPYPVDGGVGVQFIRADRFYPISFNASGQISQCVFVDQVRRGKRIFTRLEIHTLDGTGLTIRNIAFSSESDGVLGSEIPLESVEQWQGIEPEARFLGAKRLPIGMFKVSQANTVDPGSPLGVSIYARAEGLIREADVRYSNECWELVAKQAAIHLAAGMLKLNKDTGKPEYPAGMERLYRTVEYDNGATEKPLLDVFSPDIRDTSLKSTYQDQLRRIEFVCGLAYGTISDPQATDKTAEEVRSSKQRLYATVTDAQMALEDALTDFAAAVALWLNVPAPSVTFAWDDSIVVDSNALAQRALLEVQVGVIDAVEYHMRVYGLEQADAEKLVAEIEARKPKVATTDFFAGQREEEVQ